MKKRIILLVLLAALLLDVQRVSAAETGDMILTAMYGNNTQNTVKDDIIVSIRYSNITF